MFSKLVVLNRDFDGTVRLSAALTVGIALVDFQLPAVVGMRVNKMSQGLGVGTKLFRLFNERGSWNFQMKSCIVGGFNCQRRRSTDKGCKLGVQGCRIAISNGMT